MDKTPTWCLPDRDGVLHENIDDEDEGRLHVMRCGMTINWRPGLRGTQDPPTCMACIAERIAVENDW